MKPKSILRLLFIASLVIPAACDVKDPIFNTAHPDHGIVTLTTDWSGIGSGLTAPDSYTVTAGIAGTTDAAAYTATLTGVTNRLDHLFAPGTYRFCVCNTPEHLTLSGTAATVAEATGNVDGVGKFIQSAPGWLFASLSEFSVARDAEHALTAKMQQQVRQLTLIVEPTGGTTGRIDRIEGYLTGAASSLNLSTGTHAGPRNVELQFSRITSGADAGKWSATVRLLGIAGTGQKLNISLHFADGTPRTLSTDSDLTHVLATFNADKREPFRMKGSIVIETPTGSDFTATITDWETVTGDPVVAD